MFAMSHIAQTAACDELYLACEPAGEVCSRALIPDQIPRSATAEPIQIPVVFKTRVWRYFARGIMGRHSTVIIGTRYPRVVYVEATDVDW